jgi:hypothetical protein
MTAEGVRGEGADLDREGADRKQTARVDWQREE